MAFFIMKVAYRIFIVEYLKIIEKHDGKKSPTIPVLSGNYH